MVVRNEVEERCPMCNVLCGVNTEYHRSTIQHRFNMILYQWVKGRKSVVKDKNGIRINISSNEHNIIRDTNKGVFKVNIHRLNNNVFENVVYDFEVYNERKTAILLYKVTRLHPYPSFQLNDPGNLLSNVIRLEPGFSYPVKLKFTGNAIGAYSMPLAFLFQTEDPTPRTFNIIKEMKVVIAEEDAPLESDSQSSPFTDSPWTNISRVIVSPRTRNISFYYMIPEEYKRCYIHGLNITNNSTRTYIDNVETIRSEMEPGVPTKENYSQFFHHLLWIEECTQYFMVKRYNMENVTVKLVREDTLELNVPGLEENRPSLIVGDKILIRVHEGTEMYEGNISQIHDDNIWINSINQRLFDIIENNLHRLFDVSFELSRLAMERMHRALDLTMSRGWLETVLPDPDIVNNTISLRIQILDHHFFNLYIAKNEQQRLAVTHIVNGSNKPAPYIVYGPPGTGKTMTIVEAILQIVKRSKKCVVLVCAPSNAACDMLTSKLKKDLNRDQLIRVHSGTRNWDSVPAEIKPYSNYIEERGIYPPDCEALMTYRVVVSTLILAGRYATKEFVPTHVFIDEAGQAKEPEAMVAIAGLLGIDGQVVLAGDPKQLGPTCNSKKAQELGLGTSLLERLMTTCPLYENSNNPNFIMKLKLNFRSHPDILTIPNELFYEGELQPVSEQSLNDQIVNINFYRDYKKNGRAIEFHSTTGQESREGQSPSYFNLYEINVIKKYLDSMLAPHSPIKIKSKEIGIITPYMRQVCRIKNYIKRQGWNDIEVGTTEAFQGREKRVIIISTVRAQESLLLFDKMYRLGFVADEKRFNVAITRAKCKLIVIGNPHCLSYDERWLHYIKRCQSIKSFRGSPFTYRDEALRQDIIDRFDKVTFEDVVHSKKTT